MTCIMKGKSTLPNIISSAMMEEYQVIYECLDDTSTVWMWDGVNYKRKDSIRNDLIEESDTEVHDETRKTSIETENEDIIHKDITEKETAKIWIPIKK